MKYILKYFFNRATFLFLIALFLNESAFFWCEPFLDILREIDDAVDAAIDELLSEDNGPDFY